MPGNKQTKLNVKYKKLTDEEGGLLIVGGGAFVLDPKILKNIETHLEGSGPSYQYQVLANKMAEFARLVEQRNDFNTQQKKAEAAKYKKAQKFYEQAANKWRSLEEFKKRIDFVPGINEADWLEFIPKNSVIKDADKEIKFADPNSAQAELFKPGEQFVARFYDSDEAMNIQDYDSAWNVTFNSGEHKQWSASIPLVPEKKAEKFLSRLGQSFVKKVTGYPSDIDSLYLAMARRLVSLAILSDSNVSKPIYILDTPPFKMREATKEDKKNWSALREATWVVFKANGFDVKNFNPSKKAEKHLVEYKEQFKDIPKFIQKKHQEEEQERAKDIESLSHKVFGKK